MIDPPVGMALGGLLFGLGAFLRLGYEWGHGDGVLAVLSLRKHERYED